MKKKAAIDSGISNYTAIKYTQYDWIIRVHVFDEKKISPKSILCKRS